MRFRPIALAASAIAAAASLVAVGCSSAQRSESGTVPAVLPANEQMYTAAPVREGLLPWSRTAPEGFDNAPDFDLNGVLQAGGGRTPFVSDSAVGFDGLGDMDFTRHSRIGVDQPPPGGFVPVVTALPGEEVWVIIQPDRLPPPMPYAAYADDAPGCGSLMYRVPSQPEPLPFPLEHTAVEAEINGYVASVNVSQRFYNPSSQKIEALYVFPLPHDAAINGFLMTIGDRTIRGIIRPREQAERIYERARAQGHTASLLTQERANIFTQHVANIEPGRSVEVDITYFHTLAYVDGWFEYVFPMVVGPRYNPPLAAGQSGRDPSNRPVGVPYLGPGDRSGHDISIELTINAGMPITEIGCRSHRVAVRERSEDSWAVRLDSGAVIPNKDFVLRYRVAGDQTRGGIIVQRDLTSASGDGWFTMLLVPPASLGSLGRAPVEFVFVIDTSGSMQGQPLALATAAVGDALSRMVPGDTFQIIRFSEGVSALGRGPLPVNHETVREAMRYLAGLSAGGGTQMIHGIRAALEYPHDRNRQRYVVFLTDGFIGNENEILGAMHDRIGVSRVFSFGIGTSPNRLLLDEMARVGRGAAAYLAPTDDGGAVMGAFFERVSHPAMTHVEIDFGGLRAVDVYPRAIPDLFVGRPVVVTGRYTGDPDALRRDPITIRGMAGVMEHGEPTRVPVSLSVGAAAVAEGASATRGVREVWARALIRDLENESRRTGRDRRGEIEHTALRHNLMSTFTSFVAVDSATRTSGEYGVTVETPSALPAGMTPVGQGG